MLCSQSISDNARPEIELCAAINAWREELVSAADLQTTDLERRWAPSVYKHHHPPISSEESKDGAHQRRSPFPA